MMDDDDGAGCVGDDGWEVMMPVLMAATAFFSPLQVRSSEVVWCREAERCPHSHTS